MLRPRLIPILQVDNGRLVKTTRFKNPTYVGDPINAVRIFNEKEVDEIVIVDISASKQQKSPNFSLIEDLASECFMPLTYGGGIHTMEDANILFSLGVEKIALQSMLFENPKLFRDLVSRFGSQAIVFSLDIYRDYFGKVRTFSKHNKLTKKLTWEQALELASTLGIGEVLICDAGREGTMDGVDQRLIQEVTTNLPFPVVFSGGVGNFTDINNSLTWGADAVGVGAFCVFRGPNKAVLVTYPSSQQFSQELNWNRT